MSRKTTFAFRVNEQERQLLESLAVYLRRSQSDAVRWLIREAISQLKTAESETHSTQTEGKEAGYVAST